MRHSGSRYQGLPTLPFGGIRARRIGPATAVIEHLVLETDRLDLLAAHYYNDSRLWWRILDANPDLLCGVDLLLKEFAGRILLIPRAAEAGGTR